MAGLGDRGNPRGLSATKCPSSGVAGAGGRAQSHVGSGLCEGPRPAPSWEALMKTSPPAEVSVRHMRDTETVIHEINGLLIFFFLKYYTFKETPELKRQLFLVGNL